MSDQPPQRPIEQDLKAWAERRRRDLDPAGFDIQPAARQTLQEEVRRVYPKWNTSQETGTGAWIKWIDPLWTRIGLASALALVLILGLVQFLPGSVSKSGRLAMSKPDSPAAGGPNATPAARGDPRQEAVLAVRRADGNAITAQDGGAERESFEVAQAPAAGKDLRSRSFDSTSSRALARGQSAPMPALAPANTPPALPADRSVTVGLGFGDASADKKTEAEALSKQKRVLVAATDLKDATTTEARAKSRAAVATREPAAEKNMPQVQLSSVSGESVGRDSAPRFMEQDVSRQTTNLPLLAAVAAPKPDSLGAEGYVRQREQPNADALDDRFAYFRAAGVPYSRHFAQVERGRRNLNSPPRPDVLRSFLFERDGARLKITDADGSVYEGSIGSTPADDAAPSPNRGALEKASEEQLREADARRTPAFTKLPSADLVQFRVTGTNFTTGRLVVFRGTFASAASRAPGAFANTAAGRGGEVPTLDGLNGETWEFADISGAELIQGRIEIGRNRLEIQALPVPAGR